MSDGNVIIDVELNTSKAESDVDSLDSKISGISKSGEQGSIGIGKIASALGLVQVAGKAIDMIKGSIQSAFGRIDTMESFQRVMKALTGDTNVANNVLSDLKVVTKGTAFGLDTAAKAVQGFVTRGVEIPKATKYFQAFGDAVAFYGDGSKEQLENVSDALGKMLSKGKVSMDQMDRLTDAGIDGVGTYAKATGKSVETVQEELSKGSISATDFVDVVSTAFEEGTNGVTKIAGAARDAGATWGAVFTNMKAAVTRGVVAIIQAIDAGLQSAGLSNMRAMVAQVGTVFDDTLTKIAEKIPPVIAFIANLVKTLKPLVPVVLAVGAAFLTFATGMSVMSKIQDVVKWVKGLSQAFDVLKVAVLGHPILALAAVLVGLGIAFYSAYQKSETFRNVVDKLVAPMMKVIDGAKLMGQALIEMVTNGPGEKIAELREQFIKLFPAELWDNFIKFTAKLSDLKEGIKLAFMTIKEMVTNGPSKAIADLGQQFTLLFSFKAWDNILILARALKTLKDNAVSAFSGLKVVTDGIKDLFAGDYENGMLSMMKILPVDVVIAITKGVDLIKGTFNGLKNFIGGFDFSGSSFVKLGLTIAAIAFPILRLKTGILGLSKVFSLLKVPSAFSALPGLIGPIIQAVGGLGLSVSKLASPFSSIGTMVLGLFKSFSMGSGALSLLKVGLTSLLGPFGLLIKIIALVSAAFAGAGLFADMDKMLNKVDEFADNIAKAAPRIGSAVGKMVKGIGQGIAKALPGIIEAGLLIVSGLMTGLAKGIPGVAKAAGALILAINQAILVLVPLIAACASAIMVTFLASLSKEMPPIIKAFGKLIVDILLALTKALPDIVTAGLNLISAVIDGIAKGLPRYITAVSNLIVTFLTGITENLPRILNAGVDLLMAFLNGMIERLPEIVTTTMTLIVAFLDAVTAKLPDIITSGANLIIAWLQGIALNLPGIINAAVDVIVAFLQGIANNLPRIINSAVDVIVAFIQGIGEAIPRLASAAMDVVDNLVQAIIDISDRMANAAVALLEGLAKSIRDNRQKVKDAAKDLLEAILEGIPGKGLFDKGRELVQGLKDGLGDIGSVVGGVFDKVNPFIKSINVQAIGPEAPSTFSSPVMARSAFAMPVMPTAETFAMPRLRAEQAIGSVSIPTGSVSSSSGSKKSIKRLSDTNKEVVRLLGVIADKNTTLNVNGRRMSEELAPTGDAIQMQRTKLGGWGLEMQ
ncbi:hypothetical protein CKN73_07370 [Carnobacterium divergens]|uniref:tape measure protein n=1 Tax=Carnobacterium divergens TaxID=2748 RepID=UPI001071F2FA|nr:tape measure protein [Carnobacterium divergens]TFJ40134.1 hypothetical protein CKN77_07470 [Carnobacterium divergens]TFJ48755.1 hypothetical protein CKN73_07370 [Carnobacterium divergens]TFJ54019.1 hypothetical protein CKN83_07275 [Carnobacterium divergens]TFJ59545.1 hypothetical protein CKN89_07715 [Carnobacterium divergens]TFJ70189.1 hypothetical protein CKN91_07330 [Carnobacterium divergens]